MEKNLVSIVIPVYNSERFLKETLLSACQTDYENYEIIVVDDGSTDGSGAICDEFVKGNALIKVYHIAHAGVSYARNYGIERAKGEYILPLDSDDKIHNSYVSKAVSKIEESNDIGIVYCQARFFEKKKGLWNLTPFSIEGMLRENIIFNCGLFRKTDWQLVGGYDESLIYGSEDYDFWLSILELGRKVVRLPEVLFYYRRREDSRSEQYGQLRCKDMLSVQRQIMMKHKNLYRDHMDVLIDMYLQQEGKYLQLRRRQRKYYSFKVLWTRVMGIFR